MTGVAPPKPPVSAGSQWQSVFPLLELVEGVRPRFIVDSVLDCGCHRWYSIAMKICGDSDAKVSAWADGKVEHSDKLLAVIRKRQSEIGLKTVAEEIVRACRNITSPIYEGVMEEARRRNAEVQGISWDCSLTDMHLFSSVYCMKTESRK